ncbi:hypothetical protein D3C73_1191100 [compost metagenome]
MQRVVGILLVAQKQAFAALGEDAQGRLGQGWHRAHVLGVAHQVQIIDGRRGAVGFAGMAPDQLGQFLALHFQGRINGRGGGHDGFPLLTDAA